jgi:hypothetical protein
MVINKTHYGIEVIIPETDASCEFRFSLRQVKTLNSCFSRHHPIIEELAKEEAKLTRKFLIRAHSMENVFKEWAVKRNYQEWEKHNKMDFNEYFHDELGDLEDKIQGISYRYWDYCKRDYPYHKYSCCL